MNDRHPEAGMYIGFAVLTVFFSVLALVAIQLDKPASASDQRLGIATATPQSASVVHSSVVSLSTDTSCPPGPMTFLPAHAAPDSRPCEVLPTTTVASVARHHRSQPNP